MKVEFRQGFFIPVDKWEWVLYSDNDVMIKRSYDAFNSATEAEEDWEKYVRSVANAERITKRSLK